MSNSKHYIMKAAPACSICGRPHSSIAAIFGPEDIVYICEDHSMAIGLMATQHSELRFVVPWMAQMVQSGIAGTDDAEWSDRTMMDMFIEAIHNFEDTHPDATKAHLNKMVKAGIFIKSDK